MPRPACRSEEGDVEDQHLFPKALDGDGDETRNLFLSSKLDRFHIVNRATAEFSVRGRIDAGYISLVSRWPLRFVCT